jgi:hypothetical protein
MQARLLLGLTLSALLAVQEKAAPELKEFSSKEGGFTVLLPGTPQEHISKTGGAEGKEIVNHVFTVKHGSATYTVAYLIDPILAKGKPEDSKKWLESASKAAEATLKGKLLSEKPITLETHPGVEFQLEIPGSGIYRSRAYIVNDRLYQVTVLGPKELAQGKEADRILDSFKLMK